MANARLAPFDRAQFGESVNDNECSDSCHRQELSHEHWTPSGRLSKLTDYRTETVTPSGETGWDSQ